MKKLIVASLLLGSGAAFSQSNFAQLDINNIKAGVNSQGALFWDFMNPKFEVPKGSGRSTIFASNLWFGGIDASNTLKIAGSTYRQTGNDFWPGPLDATASITPSTIAAYDRVWKLNKCDIDSYMSWFYGGELGPNPVDSVAMNTILTWPASSPSGASLAPYNDTNGNGVYDPYAGDYPVIKGDQAIFFVYNDKGGVHTETGGNAIGLEIQCMVYEYGCNTDSVLANTVFVNYKITNKSSFRLDSAFMGSWTDFDIGSATDDFVGCDVGRSTYYAFNGDSIDDSPPAGEIPYGLNPPAQGVVLLTGPYADPNGLDDVSSSVANGTNYGDSIIDNERLGMGHFLYFENDASPMGNPSVPADYYDYMAGAWRDGTPWTYGGYGHLTGTVCKYLFPGSSDPGSFGTFGVPQSPWDEVSDMHVPSDRRGVASYGPFTWQPGAVNEIDLAYVYAKASSGGNLASVSLLKERIDSLHQKFSSGITACGCSSTTGIATHQSTAEFSIYPNPANDHIIVKHSGNNATAAIYDATGKLLKYVELQAGGQQVDISELPDGLYFITLSDGKKLSSARFIKTH
ncbi:MAG: T9SS type A sorting domain-containing protein [Bacteroidia bacterium]